MKAENIEEAMTDRYEAPNFDLLLKACQTTAKALFPNFMFLDAPFNQNEKWRADDPKRYIYELATMGCRTRVFENVAGEKSSLGRGNLSFTTLNMPRLAIEARIKAENLIEDERNKDAIEQKAKRNFHRIRTPNVRACSRSALRALSVSAYGPGTSVPVHDGK